MQIAALAPLDRFEPKALALGGMAGAAAGTTLWLLGVVSPWSILEAVAYAGCGGSAVWLMRRSERVETPAETPAGPHLVVADLPRDVTSEAQPDRERVEAATQLRELDPFFGVTERQLHSVVTQTQSAAADIIAALQGLDAAQTQSAACVSRTRGRMVSLAEESDTALRGLEEKLAAYLRDRLEGTRSEYDAIGGIGEQMRDLNSLTVGMEKVGSATRMLALNANIEATRAGSYGAGFQVIARELQSLAQGSQEVVAEARRRVVAVQQTIEGVVAAARDAERTKAEEARIHALIGDLDGIVSRTTRTIADMAQTELSELEHLSGRVGDQVLTVFGQVQFQDVVRQQIEAVGEAVQMLHGFLGDLRLTLEGQAPDGPIRADLLMEAVRARYVTQIQRQTDAHALGGASETSQTTMIELF